MFEVKFQVQIRQKFCSKWNDIGHTLELGTNLGPISCVNAVDIKKTI